MSGEAVRVLGVDPGTASTGYGVIEAHGQRLSVVCGGVITTVAGRPLESRLGHILGELGALLDRHEPDAVAVEEIYFGRNVRTAFAVGQARGAVLGAAGIRGIACFAYTPQAVKLAVCGSGQAGKEQVGRMVGALLGLESPPEPDHTADALAVAVCHAHRATGARNPAGALAGR